MKVKSIIFCAVAACAMAFTGCRANVANERNAATTTTAHTTATTMTTTAATVNEIVETDGAVNDNFTTRNTAVEGTPSTAVIEIEDKPNGIINLSIPTQSSVEKIDNKKICWGLGKETDSSGRPTDAVSANEKYKVYNAKFIGENEKNIYLTFDEGYENGYTEAILDVLRDKGAKATFFVTYDYCRNSPDLVRRMIDEGHAVGNHSYTHPSFPECSVREVNEEISFLHNYVEENFNYKMSLIRFPKGEFSNRSLAIADSLGYKSVFWSFAHVDWDVKNQPSKDTAYKRITEATHPGAIVLLHAVSSANAQCLADVIDYWYDNGYKTALIS